MARFGLSFTAILVSLEIWILRDLDCTVETGEENPSFAFSSSKRWIHVFVLLSIFMISLASLFDINQLVVWINQPQFFLDRCCATERYFGFHHKPLMKKEKEKKRCVRGGLVLALWNDHSMDKFVCRVLICLLCYLHLLWSAYPCYGKSGFHCLEFCKSLKRAKTGTRSWNLMFSVC